MLKWEYLRGVKKEEFATLVGLRSMYAEESLALSDSLSKPSRAT